MNSEGTDQERGNLSRKEGSPHRDKKKGAPGYSSIPPFPPSGLRVEAIAGGFEISWKAVEGFQDTVQYFVVRREGEIPQCLGDGELMSPALVEPRFRDTTVPLGKTVYYAVFSRAGERISKQGAVSSGVIAHRRRGFKGLRATVVLGLLAVSVVAVSSLAYWSLSLRSAPTLPSQTPSPPQSSQLLPSMPERQVPERPTFETPVSKNSGSKPSLEAEMRSALPPATRGSRLVLPEEPVVKAGEQSRGEPISLTPTLTVVGVGDSGMVDLFTGLLTENMRQEGFQVIRPGGILELQPLLHRRVVAGEILQALGAGTIDILIWVEAHEAGRRELRFRNRRETLFTTAIEVYAFTVSDQKVLGGGLREQVDHSRINTQKIANEIARKIGQGLGVTLETSWMSYRQGRL